MTLPVSGKIRFPDDINAELGNPVSTKLRFDSPEVLELIDKSPGDTVRLPDDFYGKSDLGQILGSYTVNVGSSGHVNPSYEFLGYSGDLLDPWGLLNGQDVGYYFVNPSPAYRSGNIRAIYGLGDGYMWNFFISISGTDHASDFVTAVKVGGVTQKVVSVSQGQSSTGYYCGLSASDPQIWDGGDVNLNRTVEIYGK